MLLHSKLSRGNLHTPDCQAGLGPSLHTPDSKLSDICLRNKLKIPQVSPGDAGASGRAAPELGCSSHTWHKQDISKLHFILWWLDLNRRGNDCRGDRDTEPEIAEP